MTKPQLPKSSAAPDRASRRQARRRRHAADRAGCRARDAAGVYGRPLHDRARCGCALMPCSAHTITRAQRGGTDGVRTPRLYRAQWRGRAHPQCAPRLPPHAAARAHAGTNYGPYNGPPMPPEKIATSFEDHWKQFNSGAPVPANGTFTDEKGGCYIWEPRPGERVCAWARWGRGVSRCVRACARVARAPLAMRPSAYRLTCLAAGSMDPYAQNGGKPIEINYC